MSVVEQSWRLRTIMVLSSTTTEPMARQPTLDLLCRSLQSHLGNARPDRSNFQAAVNGADSSNSSAGGPDSTLDCVQRKCVCHPVCSRCTICDVSAIIQVELDRFSVLPLRCFPAFGATLPGSRGLKHCHASIFEPCPDPDLPASRLLRTAAAATAVTTTVMRRLARARS